jgi:O-acetyl-ADP-ribose deacetylase (regulator of RNase III)
MLEKLGILQGDITKLATDAVVNAANESLLGGGGVDGAIHRAAGPQLLAECRSLNGCKTGEAKITQGYNLPAQWIIHTVGPVWKNGESGEPEALRSCYTECLKLAVVHNIKTIAFPAISCGVYGFPVDQAARIAIGTTIEFLKTEGSSIDGVSFVCFSDEDYDIYVEVFGELC